MLHQATLQPLCAVWFNYELFHLLLALFHNEVLFIWLFQEFNNFKDCCISWISPSIYATFIFGGSCFIGLPFTGRSIVLQWKQLETSSMIYGFLFSKARHWFNTSSNLAWPSMSASFHLSTNRCIKPSLWFDERYITYKMLFRFDDTIFIIINMFDTHSFSAKQATSAVVKFFSCG